MRPLYAVFLLLFGGLALIVFLSVDTRGISESRRVHETFVQGEKAFYEERNPERALTYLEQSNAWCRETKRKKKGSPGWCRASLGISGQALVGVGRIEEAVQQFTELIEEDESPTAFNVRGRASTATDYYDRGRAYLCLMQGAAAASDMAHFLEVTQWKDKSALYAVLTAYFGYRMSAKENKAKAILEKALQTPHNEQWPIPLIRYFASSGLATELQSAEQNPDQLIERHAYLGLDLLVKGDKEKAGEHFKFIVEYKDQSRHMYEYDLANALLKKMGKKASSIGS